MTSIKDRIKAADDLPKQEVKIAEWGDESGPLVLYIRTMGSRERDEYEASLVEGRGKNQRTSTKNARAKMLVSTAVDEAGKPIFDQSDIEWLGEKSAKVVDRLVDIAMAMSGFTDKDIDHLVGN